MIRWLFQLRRTDLVSCKAISDGLEAYIEPVYYPEGFDFEYENLTSGEIKDAGTLIFEVDWETDTLVVSEDYYEYNNSNASISKTTYDLPRNAEGKFQLEVSRKGNIKDEHANYFIRGEESGTYVMRIDFPANEETVSEQSKPEADPEDAKAASLEAAVSKAILEWDQPEQEDGLYHCESHVIFDTVTASGTPAAGGGSHKQEVTVYALVLAQTYDLSSGAVVSEGGSHIPTAITFEADEDGNYNLKEYWLAEDGDLYEASIREKFPDEVEAEAMDTQKYILSQKQNCYRQAVEWGQLNTDAIVERLLTETFAETNKSSNFAASYKENSPITYRELTYYGAYTLKYCFTRFLESVPHRF